MRPTAYRGSSRGLRARHRCGKLTDVHQSQDLTLNDAPHCFSAVVLAAGAGSRFGGAKLTRPWRNGVLLDGALAAACAAPVDEVLVVTGGDPAVGPAAQAFARARGEARLRILTAPDWGEGLAASLRAGLAAVSKAGEGAFIFLGDMPQVPHDLAARLAQAFGRGVEAVQPTVGGEPGHPVLLGRGLFAAAGRLTGDRGAQSLLSSAKLVQLEVDAPGARLDVDTPEALDDLQRRAGQDLSAEPTASIPRPPPGSEP